MSQKMRSSWGSLTKIKKNVYRIRFWGDKHDGKGYRRLSKTVRGTRKEAESVMAELRVGYDDDSSCITLRGAYVKWWLPYSKRKLNDGDLAAGSYKRHVNLWENQILPVWGDMEMNCIKAMDIQQWLYTLPHSTAEACLTLMRRAYHFAEMNEEIVYNVCDRQYDIPKLTHHMDKGIYNAKQLHGIYKKVEDNPYLKIPFILAAFGSCRPGESLGATKDDVRAYTIGDRTFALVDINKRIGDHGEIIHKLKNPQSVRTVVIAPPMSKDVLKAATASSKWIAKREDGSPISIHTLRFQWKKFFEENTEYEFHPFRNLRNSWRTMMAWDGAIAPEKLEKMMGHLGSGIGEVYYNRPTEEMFAETINEAIDTHGLFKDW